MLIKRLKISQDLSCSHPADISSILSEVKQHGFYSAYCINLMPDIVDHAALIGEIQHMAACAELRVTFNADKTICIFED